MVDPGILLEVRVVSPIVGKVDLESKSTGETIVRVFFEVSLE